MIRKSQEHSDSSGKQVGRTEQALCHYRLGKEKLKGLYKEKLETIISIMRRISCRPAFPEATTCFFIYTVKTAWALGLRKVGKVNDFRAK